MNATPSNPPTVLIIDDDLITLRLLEGDLRCAGFSTRTAATGAEGLAILEAEPSDIVITDWLMPGMTGMELCRQLRARPHLESVYVLMLTVNSDTLGLTEAFEAGVDDFLAKPFEPGVLLARMRAARRFVAMQLKLAERNAELELLNGRLLEQVMTDELTGLPSRRAGLARLRECWELAERFAQPLACALIDIDHFKVCNDTYGHAVGDEVLRAMAGVLRESGRGSDLLCRYGGEEFLLLLQNQTVGEAAARCDRIGQQVASRRLAAGSLSLRLTVSIGVAERTAGMISDECLLIAADNALYAAKEAGRNQVRTAA